MKIHHLVVMNRRCAVDGGPGHRHLAARILGQRPEFLGKQVFTGKAISRSRARAAPRARVYPHPYVRSGRSDTRKGVWVMATPTTVRSSPQTSSSSVDTRIYQEGIVAGVLGALTVALWFLVVDMMHGRPFYTPTVLGQVLFGRGVWPATLETLPPSFEMVAMFTWVHVLAFVGVAVVAAYLIAVAEQHPSLGFGIVLLFVILEACFTVAAMIA